MLYPILCNDQLLAEGFIFLAASMKLVFGFAELSHSNSVFYFQNRFFCIVSSGSGKADFFFTYLSFSCLVIGKFWLYKIFGFTFI